MFRSLSCLSSQKQKVFLRGLFVSFGLFLFWTKAAWAQNTIKLSQSIGGTSEVSGLPQYIQLIYNYAIPLGVVLAVIMVVIGGFCYLIGSATSDVKQGQDIVKDALVGLLLVLLAYVILVTVNPATVQLRMPDLQKIAREADFELKDSPEPPGSINAGKACAKDSECDPDGKCIRTGFVPLESGPGVDKTKDDQQKLGHCSDGATGSRCRCEGQGCKLTSSSGRGPHFREDTNNGGTGAIQCDDETSKKNRCLFDVAWSENAVTRQEGSGGLNWQCRITPSRGTEASLSRRADQKVSCVRDSDCVAQQRSGAFALKKDEAVRGSAFAQCIRTGTTSGECSTGRPGDRCRCKGDGCRPYDGVAGYTISCSGGFDCALFDYQDGVFGMNADWFCAQRQAEVTGSRAGRACAVDNECHQAGGEVCLRTGDGGPDQDGLKQGLCTDGGEGRLCRCAEGGCNLTRQETNAGNRKEKGCKDGLHCIFLPRGTNRPFDSWTCQRENTRPISVVTALRTSISWRSRGTIGTSGLCANTWDCPRDPRRRAGRENGFDPAMHGRCMRVDTAPDGNANVLSGAGHSGECSFGERGDRCRCHGYGCTVQYAGRSSEFPQSIPCNTGLACQPFLVDDSSRLFWMRVEWFCVSSAP